VRGGKCDIPYQCSAQSSSRVHPKKSTQLKFYPHHLLFSSLARRHGGFLASIHMQHGPYTDSIHDLEQAQAPKQQLLS
jgi:hypothetical protein